MRIRTLQKWAKVCSNVADLPPGKICNERGMICNVANLPLGARSVILQIFQEKVCNVADLPGGLQYDTGTRPLCATTARSLISVFIPNICV